MGATGLVGSHVAQALEALGPTERTAFSRSGGRIAGLDIRDAAAVLRIVQATRPDVVVCAAAEPFVERCEREPEPTAAINVAGAANVAQAAAAVGAVVVFFSSDYVFDGGHAPYGEHDTVGPINEYGRQKVAAERIVGDVAEHLILRTSGVFGIESRRKNFVQQVVDRVRVGERFPAADDQTLCPTAATELAAAVVELIALGARGVVHVCGPEALTRADFARRVARAFGLDESAIVPVPTSRLGLLAPRPRDTSMRTDRLASVLGHALGPITDALARLRDSGPDGSARRPPEAPGSGR